MNTLHDDDDRPPAIRHAADGTERWAEAAHHQLSARLRHADFYALAGEMVGALYALDDLAVLLSRQVGRYGDGRALYDDTRTVEPDERLTDAAYSLAGVHMALGTAAAAANAFWSAIGHIGVEVAP